MRSANHMHVAKAMNVETYFPDIKTDKIKEQLKTELDGLLGIFLKRITLA